MYLSATQIANKLGMARLAINPLLEGLGLQERNEKGAYVPTEKGRKLCRIRKGENIRTKEPYEMLTWNDKVLEELKVLGPPSREEFKSEIADLQTQIDYLKAQILPSR